MLVGSDRSPFARGQGATKTFRSWDVKGKPTTKKKGTTISGEKWYDSVI
jgi:hypothetical protein